VEDLVGDGEALELSAGAALNLGRDFALETGVNVAAAEVARQQPADRARDREVAGALLEIAVAAAMDDGGRRPFGLGERLRAADPLVEVGDFGLEGAGSPRRRSGRGFRLRPCRRWRAFP
jgi:hypothetical protein